MSHKFLQSLAIGFLATVTLGVQAAYAQVAPLDGSMSVNSSTLNAGNLNTYWNNCFADPQDDDNVSFAVYVGQNIQPQFGYEYYNTNAQRVKAILDSTQMLVYNPSNFASNGTFSYLSNLNPNLNSPNWYDVKVTRMQNAVQAINNTVGRPNIASMYVLDGDYQTYTKGGANGSSPYGWRTSYTQGSATPFAYSINSPATATQHWSCVMYYVARCGDGILDNTNQAGGTNTDGKQGINTSYGFINWMNTSFTAESCDMGTNNSNTIPGRCKMDCSGIVPQPVPTCNSITVNPSANPLNQGTNANITCNATNASYYDITINNGLIPDTNGVSQYLFNVPGTFNINCTVWNADYSHSATCPVKVMTVQSIAPQCQSFTATPNPVQVGQPVTMVCDGNQYSNTYQILVNNQNSQLVGSFNGGLPGPNNVVTTTWTPNAPGTYTLNCAVSNNNTQVAQCPNQVITVLQPGQPDLWIHKTVNPNQVSSGGVLTFTITFGNSGSVVATGVTVQDLLPPTVNYVGGTVSISLPGTAFNSTNTVIGYTGITLQPGQQGTMTLQATLNCSICNGSLINTAQIFNPQDWAQATAPFSPILSPAQIVLDKKQSISGQAFTDNTVTVVSGQTITYQVTVSNIGGQAQTNLFINDIMPVGVDYVSSTINVPGYPGVTVSANTIGVQDVLNTSTFTLQPGQTATLTVVGYVSELHNVYTNIAKAIIFPSTVVAQDSVNAIGQGPALTLDKIILNSQASYMPGDTITYQITFSNVGNGAAYGATIQDILPPSVTYVSSTITPNPNGATFTNINNGTQTTFAYNNFTINPGDTYVVIVTGTVNANLLNTTNTLNTAILSATNHPTLIDTVAFPTSPVPQITKMQSVNGGAFTHQQVAVMLNDTITYQVIVKNAGATAAINARVTDYLPAGLQYISSSFTLNVSLTTGPFGTNQTYVRYDGFTLQPGQQATMTIVAKVVDVTSFTQYNNQAQLEFFNPYQSVNDNVIAIPAPGADVVFTKSITTTQSTYQGGDNISFRVTLANNGPATINNVTVSDIWPATCVNFVSASVSNNAFVQSSNTNPYAWQIASMAAGQSVNIDLVGTVRNDANCAGVQYNTGKAVYTLNNNTITLERPVPFTIVVPNPGLCASLETDDSTVILIDDNNDEGNARFTCRTTNNQTANIRIDCGNGQTYSQLGSSLSYTCNYDDSDIGDRPLVQCFVDNVTNSQCQQRVIIDEPRLSDCGNGTIEGYEQCDLGEGTHTIHNWLDSDHDVRASSRDEGDSCRSCSIRNSDGGSAYEPPACFGVNTSLSVQKGEILPFRWYLQNNTNIVKNESNCHNLDDGKIPADSMKCFFSIYKNHLDDPILDNIQLDCDVDQWNNDVYYDFFKQHYADAANALGKFSFPMGDAMFGKYGEYKIVLEKVEYDYCKDNHTDNGEVVERICDVDFALTKPYMIARTALGTKPQASTTDLSNFYDINDNPILNSTDINNVLVTNESHYNGGTALPSLVSSFVTNYSNLGVTVNNASFANLFEGGNQITIKKVPGKQIYIFEGNGANRLTLKELDAFDKPFTMIVKNMDLVIKGSMTNTHGMFVVQGGKVSFVEPDSNKCAQRQVVNGVFITDNGFGVNDANITINNHLGTPRCNEGGLTVRGVLIGNGLEDLVNQRRSHLNEWFRVTSSTEATIKAERRNKIFNGAALLIDYNPNIWSDLPPGMSEFTQVLDVYRQ